MHQKVLIFFIGLVVFSITPVHANITHNDSTCHKINCHQWHVSKTFYEDGKIKSINKARHPIGSHCDVADGTCKTIQIEKLFYNNGKLKEHKQLKISGSGWSQIKSKSTLKEYGINGKLTHEVIKQNGKTVYERNNW